MLENGKKIRVALLCRGYTFDAWEAECIRQVMSLPFVEIVLLIAQPADVVVKQGFPGKIIRYPYRHLLWRFFKRFQLKIPAYVSADLQAELKHIPLQECHTELKGKYSQHFTPADIATIRSHQPDVILRFAYNILRGEILTVAQYGVWSFHHADEQKIRGGPAAFWEIIQRDPVTSAILQRLTEKLDAGIVLRKGSFRTIPRSYKANLQQLLSGTGSWMKQALIDVYHGHSPAVNGTPVVTSAPVFTFPRNTTMLNAWRMTRAARWKFHFRELFRPEKWTVGILRQDAGSVVQHGITGEISWLDEMPRGKYIADPFGWRNEQGELQIVAEEYHYRTARGFISCVAGNKKTGILAMPFHFSYPFVVQQEEVFLIPEASQTGKLRMYDMGGKSSVLLLDDFAAVDASPVFFHGKWWLFCTKGGDMSNTELYIFHATSLTGAWEAHANNPVKCDIASARPGGTPFIHNGKLYRPSQDCSITYGSAVVLNEVISLSETTFSEQPVRRLVPQPEWKFNKGLHTFSVVDSNTILVDAKRQAFNFYNFKRKSGKKISRFFHS